MKGIYWIIISIFLIAFMGFYFLKDSEEPSLFEKDPNRAYLFPPFDEFHKNDKLEYDVSEIKDSADKEEFDKNLRKKTLELANFMTKPDEKPKIQVIGERDMGKYIEQKIIIKIYPSTVFTAYMLIPKGADFPAPLIIAMHQHGDNYENGKEEAVGNKGDENLFYGRELAERGYIVFASDAPLFGDRALIRSGENSPRTLEEFGEQSLILLGHSLLGETLREDISILNIISSLKNIDQSKVGCIGHSFGGVRCMYLAALDERIKAVVISNSIANLRNEYNEAPVHTWFSILPGIAQYTETNGILALIAPRNLMIVYSEKDPIYPLEEAEYQINSVKELYERLDKKDNFNSLLIPNESHSFPKEYHEKAYRFFDESFKD